MGGNTAVKPGTSRHEGTAPASGDARTVPRSTGALPGQGQGVQDAPIYLLLLAARGWGTSLRGVLFPLLFLPASDREGFCDVFADGFTPTSSEHPDFGERKSLMKLETSMGKPFPVPHEYNKNKFPKSPGQTQ